MPLLPELAEHDATGEPARIYREMRRLGAVPMVALVFRHLATLPGALEWAWGALAPAWRTGRLQETAWQVARRVPLVPLDPVPRKALAAIGVDEAGLREVRVVLDAYNLANPENLLSVLCLMRLLAGATAAVPIEPRAWSPPATPGPLVPMIDVAKAPNDVAALLDQLSTAGDAGGPRVVQSLYRHFGHRPALLALVASQLLPRMRDGSLHSAGEAMRTAMDDASLDLVKRLSAPPAPGDDLRPVLERFGGRVIPQMIVVGLLLERALLQPTD